MPLSDDQRNEAIAFIKAELTRLTELIAEYRAGVQSILDNTRATMAALEEANLRLTAESVEQQQYIQVLEHEVRDLKTQIHPAGG